MGRTLRWPVALTLVLSLSCVLSPAYGQDPEEVEEVVSDEGESIDVGAGEVTAEEFAEDYETEKAIESQMGAEQAKREAEAALTSGDYDLAVAKLKEAVDLAPDDETTVARLKEVQKAYVYNLLKASKYDEVLIQADDFLARFTDPSDRDVIEVQNFRETAAELSQTEPAMSTDEAGAEGGPPTGPSLADLADTELLAEAIRAYRKKDYDVAEDLLVRAREIDPYNIEVTRWLDRVKYQVHLHKRSYREPLRKDMLEQVQDAWIDRPRPALVQVGPVKTPTTVISRPRAEILEKLETIIPVVDFNEAELQVVIGFLSRDADVNIVIDPVVFQAAGAMAPTTPGAFEQPPTFPGGSGFPGEEPGTLPGGTTEPGFEGFAPQGGGVIPPPGPYGSEGAPPPGTTFPDPGGFAPPAGGMAPGAYAPPESLRITLRLTGAPLKEVLKYVLRIKNLKFVVEDYAILIIPINYVLPEELETEIFRLSTSGVGGMSYAPQPGFGGGGEDSDFGGGGFGSSGFGEEPGAGMGQAGTIEEWLLRAGGVTWPTGSSAKYHQPTATLIVTNTPTNMVLIRELIKIWDRPPMQVEVEARFAEVIMDHAFENAFRVGMTESLRWTRTSGRNRGTVPLSSRERIEMLSNPGGLIGTISSDATANWPEALTGAGTADMLFGIAGILTRPEFAAVWYALDKTTSTEILSAPRVTTISGQQATIQLVEEIRYPTEYETESIEDIYGSQIGVPLFQVTPSTFEIREVGVRLSVTPTVSSDGEVITLVLLPEVSALIDWIDYGTPPSQATMGDGSVISYPGIPLRQPKFESRNVTTTVYINDGETLVLGGVIKSTATIVEDRVPILGSLPILGRLFRGSYEIEMRKNLMIFVTADLITSRGTRIRQEREITEQRSRYLEQYQRELEAAQAEGR